MPLYTVTIDGDEAMDWAICFNGSEYAKKILLLLLKQIKQREFKLVQVMLKAFPHMSRNGGHLLTITHDNN